MFQITNEINLVLEVCENKTLILNLLKLDQKNLLISNVRPKLITELLTKTKEDGILH